MGKPAFEYSVNRLLKMITRNSLIADISAVRGLDLQLIY